MSASEVPVPLSAAALRLADEVGQAVLDRIGAGDLAGAAELDQHVAAVRAELATCEPAQTTAARRAGESAGISGAAEATGDARACGRPHHARRTAAAPGPAGADRAAGRPGASGAAAATTITCPDVPFASSPWGAEGTPPRRLLLHYACGFTEAAVRADWWPTEPPAVGDRIDWRAMRLAATLRLIRQAEAAATLHPDLC